ncbi:MAG: DUF1697 domain-containing protein [Anaerolineae bacterium]|nr:DUF1697 domain-containing protein [Anaerolineae bacterium]
MHIYVALLRGINIGPHKQIKMDQLRALCTELGWDAPQTYIQTGNVVFEHPSTPPERLAADLRAAIQGQLGFDAPVLVRSVEEYRAEVAANPFAERHTSEPKALHIAFLGALPAPERIAGLPELPDPREAYAIIARAVYLYCPAGYGRSNIPHAFWERHLKVPATVRNWNTALALRDLATARATPPDA